MELNQVNYPEYNIKRQKEYESRVHGNRGRVKKFNTSTGDAEEKVEKKTQRQYLNRK